jgi:hypothetical protein
MSDVLITWAVGFLLVYCMACWFAISLCCAASRADAAMLAARMDSD